MKFLKRIGLGIGVVLGLLGMVDLAVAQSMTGSLQTDRMTVLQVNKEAGQIYCLEADGRLRVVEFHNGAVPLIVTDKEQRADLRLLHAGDLIKVEGKDGRAHKIVVLRQAWAEQASPEQ